MSALTVVMYHYVRDRARNRYPGLKVRSVEEFDGQLDYITRHYRVCDTRAVLAAARGEGPLPPNACLLTFDDGLLDHFTTVFPRLVERGLPGSFYVPVAAVESRRGLGTHKNQIVLAAPPHPARGAPPPPHPIPDPPPPPPPPPSRGRAGPSRGRSRPPPSGAKPRSPGRSPPAAPASISRAWSARGRQSSQRWSAPCPPTSMPARTMVRSWARSR